MDNKIPFYNIVNMFLIGFVFIGFSMLLFYHDVYQFISALDFNGIGFQTLITVSSFAVIYEIGFIINRIGSVIIENILVRFNLIPFNSDYKKFNERKKQYPIMGILSREYASSRSTLTLFLLLMILSITQNKWFFSGLFFLVSLLFLFSARKHALKIVKLMEDKI